MAEGCALALNLWVAGALRSGLLTEDTVASIANVWSRNTSNLYGALTLPSK